MLIHVKDGGTDRWINPAMLVHIWLDERAQDHWQVHIEYVCGILSVARDSEHEARQLITELTSARSIETEDNGLMEYPTIQWTPETAKKYFDQTFPGELSLDGETIVLRLDHDTAEWLAGCLPDDDGYTIALWWYVFELKKKLARSTREDSGND